MLRAYGEAGGARAIVLCTTSPWHALIDALARFGDGLPPTCCRFGMNEVTTGRPRGRRRRLRLNGRRRCGSCCAPSRATMLQALRKRSRSPEADPAGLGFGSGRIATIGPMTPMALGAALRGSSRPSPRRGPRAFSPSEASGRCCGSRARFSLRRRAHRRHRAARGCSFRSGQRSMWRDAPLCLAACRPVRPAASRHPDQPCCASSKDVCVQCGFVPSDVPREGHHAQAALDFRAATAAARVSSGRSRSMHPLRQARSASRAPSNASPLRLAGKPLDVPGAPTGGSTRSGCGGLPRDCMTRPNSIVREAPAAPRPAPPKITCGSARARRSRRRA